MCTVRCIRHILAALALLLSAVPAPGQMPESDPERAGLMAQRNTLIDKTTGLFEAGEFDKAFSNAEWISALERRIYGDAHNERRLTLKWLVTSARKSGRWDRAYEFSGDLLAVLTALYGENDYRTVEARVDHLHFKALSNLSAGQKNWLTLADKLQDQAGTDFGRGDYAAAVAKAKQILDILVGVWGEEDPEICWALNNVGTALGRAGDYEAGIPYLERALRIKFKAYGGEHPQTADVLREMAVLDGQLERYDTACKKAEAACRIFEKTLGPGAQETNHASYILGSLYGKMGRLAESLELLQRCLKEQEEHFPPDSMDLVDAIEAVAGVYGRMSDRARQEPLLRRALKICRANFEKRPIETANLLLKLGYCLEDKSQLEERRGYFIEALQICEKELGESQQTAEVLNSLGIVSLDMDDARAARGYFDRSLAMRRRVLPPTSLDIAQSLLNLAMMYESMGDDARAESHFREAIAMQPGGTEDLIGSWNESWCYGVFLLERKRYKDAEPHLRMASRRVLNELQNSFGAQSSQQMLTMLASARLCLDAWLCCRLESGTGGDDVYSALLAWKGAIAADQGLRAAARDQPETQAAFAEIRQVTSRLSALTLQPAADGDDAERRAQIARLAEQRDQLESQLAASSSAFRKARRQHQVNAAKVADSLEAGAVLVDLFEYRRVEPADPNRPLAPGKINTEYRLAAFIVQPGGAVSVVELGPSERFRQLVDRWLAERDQPFDPDQTNSAGAALRALFWDRVAPQLAAAQTVLVSPDGPMCRLPIAALPGEKPGSYLIEERAVAVAPVPQLLPELLATRQARAVTAPQSLLLVGSVDYGGSPGLASTFRGAEEQDAAEAIDGMRSGALPTFRTLRHSEQELSAVQAAFRAAFGAAAIVTLSGEHATEDRFRGSIGRSRWVHLITHGFFAPTRLRSALSPGADTIESQSFGRSAAVATGYNPGLLSGLAFAGANTAPAEGEDDGILTALEAETLNLGGVELAVLSACETGLGEETSAGGEGLLGLQRAFQIAGAQSVISSLWRVPDRETNLLMQRFYENLWLKQMSKAEALREAQIWLLKGGDEFDREDVSPAEWAAFVLSGDWR